MKLVKSFVVVMAVLALSVGTINAVPLPPGGSTPAVSEPDPIGGFLLNQINTPFVSPSFTGNLISSVWLGDTSSPFGTNQLTFTYELILTGGPDAASAVSIGSFNGFLTDVSYQVPSSIGLGLAPTLISRNPMGSQAVKFDFSGSGYLQPGQNTLLLVVQTDALIFTLGTATILDDFGSPNVTTLVPAAVPEPATATCLLLGLGVLALTRRFRMERK